MISRTSMRSSLPCATQSQSAPSSGFSTARGIALRPCVRIATCQNRKHNEVGGARRHWRNLHRMFETKNIWPHHTFTPELAQQFRRNACGLKPWHDEDVRRSAEASKRIIALLHLVVERDVRSHFAFELKIRLEAGK